MARRVLRESKKNLDLAVIKCLTKAPLNPSELHEICAVTQADLMRDHGCDLYMAEQVMLHTKKELFRLRAQNLFTRFESPEFDGGYPKKPYTRTYPLKENHHMEDRSHGSSGRMLDYGHSKSDSEEGRMMKQALRDIAVDAYRMHQMLEDGDDLPQWCQYKAAQAQQMIGSVRNYLEYKLERMGGDLVGEKEMFDPSEMAQDFGQESADMAMDTWSSEYENEGYAEDDIDLEDPQNAATWAAGYQAGGGEMPDEEYDNEPYEDFEELEDSESDEDYDLDDEDLEYDDEDLEYDEDEDLEYDEDESSEPDTDENLDDEDLEYDEDEDLEEEDSSEETQDSPSGEESEDEEPEDGYDGADVEAKK